jgi:integrase
MGQRRGERPGPGHEEEPLMSKPIVSGGIDRHTFQKTRHRGLSYRVQANGSRRYYGYLPGRGRVQLRATVEREAVAEYGRLRGKGEAVVIDSKKRLSIVAAEFFDAESGRKRGKEFRRNFEREVEPVLGHRRIGSITAQDLIDLDKALLGRGLSESSAANYMKPLRRIMEFAVLKGYREINPFQQVPRKTLSSCNRTREHREWTTVEVIRLIEEGHNLDARKDARAEYGLTIEFKLRTGARLGEVLGARYGDIDFEQGVWKISGQWTRDGERVEYVKTKKSLRRVPLAPSMVKKIAARKLHAGASDDSFVFASGKDGNPPSHTNFRRRGWDKAVQNAGLTDGPKVTPHDARHAFASEMADLGLDSTDVAEVMGHTTAGITEKIYTHAFNRDAREERVRQAMAAAGGAS